MSRGARIFKKKRAKMKLGLASPDLGSFLSLRDAAHGRRDGRVHGHEAGGLRVREARHVERAPAVEAVPPAHWGWPTARHTKFCQNAVKILSNLAPFRLCRHRSLQVNIHFAALSISFF